MNLPQKFKIIKTFIFDVDGVLTDGTLLVLDDGQQARKMNIRDGYALQLAIKKGYRVLVISGGHSPAVETRLKKLGLTDVFLSVENKKELLLAYAAQYQLKWGEILFMGDDMPDLAVMQITGLPCSPADAVAEIKQVSVYISPVEGGKGCARDVIEKVLKLNGHWDADSSVPAR